MEISVQIGVVLIVIFLFNELLVNPLFEIVKNRLVIVRLRKLLNNGSTVRFAPENFIANKFGLSTGVRSKDVPLYVLKILKVFVKLFVLVSIAWWESGLSEVFDTNLQTVPMALDALSRTDGSVSFASVTPHVPLVEEEVEGLPVFDAEEKRNSGNYTKGRNSELELRFFSDCVEDTEDGLRVVFGALARRMSGAENRTQSVCLNGGDSRDRKMLVKYDPNDAHKQNVTIERMEFLRNLTRAGPDTLFAVRVQTATELLGTTEFMGYVSVAARTHYDNNVAWSLYGCAVAPNKEMLRIIVVLNDDLDGEFQCFTIDCLGIWTFTSTGIILPSGIPVERFYVPDNGMGNQLESIGLFLTSGILNQMGQEMQLALSWLAETPFGTFKANERFTDDVLNRLTGNVFFFSDTGVPTRTFRAFDRKRVTSVVRGRTSFLISSLAVLLLFAVIGMAAELRSRKKLGISSDIVSREAVIGMYKSDHFRIPCCDSNTEHIEIGITGGGVNEQHLGMIDMSSREPVARTKAPLGAPSQAELDTPVRDFGSGL